jgi:hypothetical protein
MGLQQQKLAPGIAMMPLMPVAKDEPSGPAPQRPKPSRADSVQAAKAKIMRRQSLRKQCAAQSTEPGSDKDG